MKIFILLSLFILFQFINGDIPNDENSNVNVYDGQMFDEFVPPKPHFIMFFAPWCGHCKRLTPTWEELALQYKDGDVVIAKVDCTQHTPLCSSQEVTGYPTLKFYSKGADSGVKYRGQRDKSSLDKYIHEQLGKVFEESVVPEAPEAIAGLVEFTDQTFERTKKGNFFIKFYAPWCGHCQRLAPEWEALAKSFEHEESVVIGKIDCTKSDKVCNEFKVKGYPSLLWIVDGKTLEKYSGDRTHDSLKKFVYTRLSQDDNKTPIVAEPNDKQTPVVSLTAENFENAIGHGLTFVKYFAPWCGHCKRLAPVYEELSHKFVGHGLVKIAKVDCTVPINKALCSQQQIKGFPTLFLYNDGEKTDEYAGDRTLEDMASFITLRIPHEEL